MVEIRDDDSSSVRENSRCSQGTGSLRQLVGRFDLTWLKPMKWLKKLPILPIFLVDVLSY